MRDIVQENKRYGPVRVMLFQFVIYGSGYLLMSRYIRYFLSLLFLFFTTAFFQAMGVIIATILIMIDTYILAKKSNGVEAISPNFKSMSVFAIKCLISLVILVVVVVFAGAHEWWAWSEESCIFFKGGLSQEDRLLYKTAAIDSCIKNVKMGNTLFTFHRKVKVPQAEECQNERLSYRYVCYFSKAIETRDYRYCYHMLPITIIGNDYQTCIKNLAGIFKDETLCDYIDSTNCMEFVKNCTMGVDNVFCEPLKVFTCEGVYYKEQSVCYEKYNITPLLN